MKHKFLEFKDILDLFGYGYQTLNPYYSLFSACILLGLGREVRLCGFIHSV